MQNQYTHAMFPYLHLIAIVILAVIITILGRFLRHSFTAQKRGLPPYINTFRRHRALIRDSLPITKGSSILDLGCGDGAMLRLFVKHFQCKKAVGYDINSFAIWRGRIINRLHGTTDIELFDDDLCNANLSGFDYIYLYLFPDFIAKIEPWLFDNLDPGTVIICNTFSFSRHTPFSVISDKNGKERLFLYRK